MNKGDIGFFQKAKRKEQIKCIAQFLAVIAFLVVGFLATETKLNYFTLVAVLSCLPASKTLVGVIVKWPVKGLTVEQTEEIEMHSDKLTVIYDAVISSKERIMPLDCLVISGNKIFGYVSSEKVNLEETTSYMKNFLGQEKLKNMNVKLFHEFSPFISRVEGLNYMCSIDTNDTQELEGRVKHSILLFCM